MGAPGRASRAEPDPPPEIRAGLATNLHCDPLTPQAPIATWETPTRAKTVDPLPRPAPPDARKLPGLFLRVPRSRELRGLPRLQRPVPGRRPHAAALVLALRGFVATRTDRGNAARLVAGLGASRALTALLCASCAQRAAADPWSRLFFSKRVAPEAIHDRSEIEARSEPLGRDGARLALHIKRHWN